MTAPTQYDLAALLERAGARPSRYGRGKWRCPKHPGSPSLSVDPDKGLFNCHHAGCDFRGSTFTLARSLGLTRRLPTAEFARQMRVRERTRKAAVALSQAIHARRMELLDELRELNKLERTAHAAGPEFSATWDDLARVYARRPDVIAALAFLENAHATQMIRFLHATPAERAAVYEEMIIQGGVYDSAGKYIEVCP